MVEEPKNQTKITTPILTWFVIIISVGFAIYVASTLPISEDRTKIPNGCGETATNRSESYIIHNMCGMSQCPLTLYYTDLVCSNGTTILKWRTTR